MWTRRANKIGSSPLYAQQEAYSLTSPGTSPQQGRQNPWDNACEAVKPLHRTQGWTLPTADSDPCCGLTASCSEYGQAEMPSIHLQQDAQGQ